LAASPRATQVYLGEAPRKRSIPSGAQGAGAAIAEVAIAEVATAARAVAVALEVEAQGRGLVRMVMPSRRAAVRKGDLTGMRIRVVHV